MELCELCGVGRTIFQNTDFFSLIIWTRVLIHFACPRPIDSPKANTTNLKEQWGDLVIVTLGLRFSSGFIVIAINGREERSQR